MNPTTTSAAPSTDNVFLLLNDDLFKEVVDHISLRDLFNLTLSCKSMVPKVTTELVVRKAVLKGGNPKERIDKLLPFMVERKSVYPPSSLRLLRLVHGRYCEARFRKYGKDSEDRRCGCDFWSIDVTSLFMCHHCIASCNGRHITSDNELCGNIESPSNAATTVISEGCDSFVDAYERTVTDPAILQERLRHVESALGLIREKLDPSWRDFLLEYDPIVGATLNDCPVRFRVKLCEDNCDLKQWTQEVMWVERDTMKSWVGYFESKLNCAKNKRYWKEDRSLVFVFNEVASKEEKIEQVNRCQEKWEEFVRNYF